MISVEEVLRIQNILIDRFGGTRGIRDMAALESAIYRPEQTFDLKHLYPTQIDKAAAIIESLIVNHPFLDGNKRIGYVTMRLVLLQADLDIEASEEEKYKFVMNIASGKSDYTLIRQWITDHQKIP